MKIEYTGRQLDVPEAVRNLAERKLRKLQRILPGATHAHVRLGADRHRLRAEVTVRSPRLDLSAVEEGADLGLSLKAAIEKVLEQARRATERRRDRRRRSAEPAPAVPAAGGEAGVRVIRSRGFVAKPMTIEEAVLEMEGRTRGPLLFRDADSEGVRVLFRRQDGHLGLIEEKA